MAKSDKLPDKIVDEYAGLTDWWYKLEELTERIIENQNQIIDYLKKRE